MKGLRNKVILSGIVLMFAFIATIGTTYAWFTVSTQSDVTGINLQVTAADNLLIKPKKITGAADTFTTLRDTANYSTSITASQMEDVGYFYEDPTTKLIPWRLKPATLLGNIDTTYYFDPQDGFTYINNIDTVISSDGATAPTYAIATDNLYAGFYITLEFWMLSQGDESKDIVLNSFSILSDALNSSAQANIQNAVRLAFWGDDSVWETEMLAEDPLFVPVVGNTYIFANDSDYAYVIDTDVTDISAPTPQVGTPAINTTAASVASLFTLQPNTPTLMTVVIYIEGWDQHASNAIILANFDIAFSFAYVV